MNMITNNRLINIVPTSLLAWALSHLRFSRMMGCSYLGCLIRHAKIASSYELTKEIEDLFCIPLTYS